MRAAQLVGVFAFVLAAGWLLVPHAADETITGSIAEMASVADATLSCDQPLYAEELELATGLFCG